MIKDGSRQPSCPVKSVVGEEWDVYDAPCFPSERQARSCEVQASRATNCTVVATAVQSWAGSRAAKSTQSIVTVFETWT